jgi:hypothetical protein
MVINAEHFVATVAANVSNKKLSDKAFRSFVRRSIGAVAKKNGSVHFPGDLSGNGICEGCGLKITAKECPR